jgi:CDP-diacylglycerol--glycerol-3-phosphate 3-phosphatidyltransferase
MSAPPPAPALRNVPDLLSLSRLPLAAGLFACIAVGAWAVGLAVFALAMLTDWLDGWWARRFHSYSPVGRSLDPLTDKVLIGGAFIYLVPILETGIAPWMATVVVARELLVTGLRGMVEATGAPFGADWFGKLKMALQSATVAGILILQTLRPLPAAEPLLPTLQWVQLGLLWAMLAATVGSLVQYVIKAGRILI